MDNDNQINIKMISPFRRICYIAMLLRFYPDDYTIDFADSDIIYGERIEILRNRLKYLQYRRILLSKGIKDLSRMDKLCAEKNWNELFTEISKYNIDEKEIDNGYWSYYRSYSLEPNGIGFHSKDVKHRLYLNVALEHRAYFAKVFIDYCAKNKMPYYFKVLSKKGQKDTIVIYIDNDENLETTINIINEIFTNIPKLANVSKEPAPHLYKINDYIGYGFEPSLIDGRKLSYTELMQECESSAKNEIIVLKNKILTDFKSGMIYPVNDQKIIAPSKDEMNNFINLDLTQKFAFFKKYFQYILAVYGNDIMKILNIIEEARNNKINGKNTTIRK